MKSCIPIEDKISPQVNSFDINEVYYYQDTILFSVIFTDNSGLDSGSLVIEKMSDVSTPGPDAWYYESTFDIRGRRIAPDFEIEIPEYKETGDYLLTVYGFDEGGNPDTVRRVFKLEADQNFPAYNNLNISLDKLSDSVYTACRSEVIAFEGYVTDNLKLSQVGFSFGEDNQNLSFYSTDSIQLSEIFEDFVRIPPDTPDSTLLELNVIAIDTFNNTTIETFNIWVDCDDEAPSFYVKESAPLINSENRVKVIQGSELSITSMLVKENKLLQDVTVYYNKSTESLQEFASVTINSTDKETYLESFVELNFSVPLTDNIGDVREVTFVATDGAGNTSELYKIYIDVIPDYPPDLIITNTYINKVLTGFSEVSYIPVNVGDYITFAGKIEEQNALSLLEMYWYEEGLPPTVAYTFNTFVELPVNLSDFHDDSSFVIPENAQPGTNYILYIKATDSKGQESVIRYLFTVVF
ncbi:DUF4625 domain-containing protein [Chondrinema litorale]|uniref:DUF4625 domain-containing protein n=1 Tax=Chondrinema litorale TaxID=2994555 RepID=UPI002543BC2F|nr:DUF4625 domain-containing protein [Chondrinema litorale]UZR96024.1 DUF4625 domain-containing protein [Chondrinema litorale]